MQCQNCGERPAQGQQTLCDVCATFDDITFDLRFESAQRDPNDYDDLLTETEFKWRQRARESHERILAKYPPRTDHLAKAR